MHYWNALLHEVLTKSATQPILLSDENFSTAGNLTFHTEKKFIFKKSPRDLRTYYLGDTFPNIYLTKREAESMFWLVQCHTIDEAACKMHLSPRTLEFYIKNLKLKLRCKSKKMLIEKVLQSDLLAQLEKDGLRIVKH